MRGLVKRGKFGYRATLRNLSGITLVLLTACAAPKPLGYTQGETVPEAVRRIEGERKHQLQQDPFQPDGAVIFLGDSITAGLAVDAVAPYAVNYGIGGQTTQLLLDALPRYGSLQRARLVVLSIGTVDMVSGRERGIVARLDALQARIPGPLVWNAIPVSAKADMRGVNAEIRRLCAARPDCTFVQAPIGREDLQADGIHLRPSGYAKWIGALKMAGRTRNRL